MQIEYINTNSIGVLLESDACRCKYIIAVQRHQQPCFDKIDLLCRVASLLQLILNGQEPLITTNIKDEIMLNHIWVEYDNWLVVSTNLKNISQIGSFPQVGVKIKNI